MFDVRQYFLLLVSFLLQHGDFSAPRPQASNGNKSIAIVGAASAGLAMLGALVDLQDDTLDIVLSEQRRDVGGTWLPDPQPVHPPVLPETPLYPLLHTNTPVPTMTYPGFPYHQDFTLQYNLLPYITYHTVLSASWVGTSEAGRWDILVAGGNGHATCRGHDHYPHSPTFPGQDAWLRRRNGSRRREIIHSMFYREPQQYANQTVVVVGFGASGRDAASQLALYARKVYHSLRSQKRPRPEIAYFAPDTIVFADGSHAHGVDAVILGTGYDLRIPFLEVTGEFAVNLNARHRSDHRLTTNTSSPSPRPILVSDCPSDVAQSTYVAKARANASLLGPREVLLEVLYAREDALRSGYDPFWTDLRND
ncbi:FAD/NAD(P)-binding domain-containing protein [Imleria badia]|nr:FAD/NAD(P)-binding domain-containing protein [Imleria badia]